MEGLTTHSFSRIHTRHHSRVLEYAEWIDRQFFRMPPYLNKLNKTSVKKNSLSPFRCKDYVPSQRKYSPRKPIGKWRIVALASFLDPGSSGLGHTFHFWLTSKLRLRNLLKTRD
uniref:Uncharacterized protein n=1 Tax=Utricularia reniformis TaxID=192314 RepID=A0A1Y0B3V7_9LAMI|nr:hypothetical protein AEK19_MT1911 [Utricularia reniformis]ART32078.1 hypothetical protein AEK19_MT1911 [Utricularia reniformis]